MKEGKGGRQSKIDRRIVSDILRDKSTVLKGYLCRVSFCSELAHSQKKKKKRGKDGHTQCKNDITNIKRKLI